MGNLIIQIEKDKSIENFQWNVSLFHLKKNLEKCILKKHMDVKNSSNKFYKNKIHNERIWIYEISPFRFQNITQDGF